MPEQGRDQVLPPITEIFIRALSSKQFQTSVEDRGIIRRDHKKDAFMVEHALDFVACGIEIIHEFKNAHSDNAIKIPVWKWKRSNMCSMELCVSVNFLQAFGYSGRVWVNIDSMQFLGMLCKLRHQDATAVADF